MKETGIITTDNKELNILMIETSAPSTPGQHSVCHEAVYLTKQAKDIQTHVPYVPCYHTFLLVIGHLLYFNKRVSEEEASQIYSSSIY